MPKKYTLPRQLTTVTPLSKTIAVLLFIFLPFVGFYLGMKYQQLKDGGYGYDKRELMREFNYKKDGLHYGNYPWDNR
jgi:hypothetical protein